MFEVALTSSITQPETHFKLVGSLWLKQLAPFTVRSMPMGPDSTLPVESAFGLCGTRCVPALGKNDQGRLFTRFHLLESFFKNIRIHWIAAGIVSKISVKHSGAVVDPIASRSILKLEAVSLWLQWIVY